MPGQDVMEEAAALPVASEEVDPKALKDDLYAWLIGAQDIAEALNKVERSRELSLVITKVEEAEMWLLRLLREDVN